MYEGAGSWAVPVTLLVGAVDEPAGVAALHDVIDAVVGVEGGAIGGADVEGELGEAAAEAAFGDELGAIAIEQIAAVAEDLDGVRGGR